MPTKNDLNAKTGSKIKHLRIVHSLTQENVADLLKISTSNYAKIERGEIDITIVRLEQIAKVFGAKITDLLAETFAQNIQGDNAHNSFVGNNQGASIQIHETAPQMEMLSQAIQRLTKRMDAVEDKIKKIN